MAENRKCQGCNGKGWIYDTTYDRSGEWVRHERCFGTGLSEAAIRAKLKPLIKPFVKDKPKAA